MILNICLATIIASVEIDFIKSLVTRDNLLKKGYVFSNKNKVDWFSTIMNFVVPGLNLYYSYKLLKRDEDKFEMELVKRGYIYKPEENKESEDTQLEPEVKEKTYGELTSDEKKAFLIKLRERISNEISSTEETGKEMTRDEKMAFLLRQRERILSEFYSVEEEISSLVKSDNKAKSVK